MATPRPFHRSHLNARSSKINLIALSRPLTSQSKPLMLCVRLVYSTRLAPVCHHAQSYHFRPHAYHPFRRALYRVINTAIPVTLNMSGVYASMDQIPIATFLTNRAVEQSHSLKLEEVVMNKLTDILLTHKNTMTASGGEASAQRVLHENLRRSPSPCLRLLKHVCVCHCLPLT